jgi:hypothetical protein
MVVNDHTKEMILNNNEPNTNYQLQCMSTHTVYLKT